MKRLFVILALVVLVSACIGLPRARANDIEEQTTVAQKFLDVYLRGDNTSIRKYIPSTFSDMTGPFPFKESPSLGQPKVDGNQALVDFTATMLDGKYLSKGGILCFRRDGVWHVRQVLFYNKIPGIFNLPTRSKSADDRRYEPTVKTLAEKFVAAWKQSDYATMRSLWFNWPSSEKEPIEHLYVSNIGLTMEPTPWKDTFVTFTARVSYKPVSWLPAVFMNVKGGFLMTKVGTEWRVRANQMIFKF